MERIKLNQFYQHIGLTDHFDQLHIKKSSPSIYYKKCNCLNSIPVCARLNSNRDFSKDFFIKRKFISYMDDDVKTSDRDKTFPKIPLNSKNISKQILHCCIDLNLT